MKKRFLLILLLMTVAGLAGAQTIAERLPEQTPTVQERLSDGTALPNPEQQFQNMQYVNLLNRQNDLLSDRVIALSLSMGGGFLSGVMTSLAQSGYTNSAVATLLIASSATALVGGVWMIINEYQLISNRKKINNNLTLRYGPTGVALQF